MEAIVAVTALTASEAVKAPTVDAEIIRINIIQTLDIAIAKEVVDRSNILHLNEETLKRWIIIKLKNELRKRVAQDEQKQG